MQTSLRKLSYSKREINKREGIAMSNISNHKNNEFYANCTEYFMGLRKKGKTDYEFEDEFYYTIPTKKK